MSKPIRKIKSKKVRTASQIGKLSRNKGAAEERRICHLYEGVLGKRVQRDISQYQESSGRDLRGCQPWCAQTKVGKHVNARNALFEAISAVDDEYQIPVAHIHDDNKEPFVLLREEDFFTIVERLTSAEV